MKHKYKNSKDVCLLQTVIPKLSNNNYDVDLNKRYF